MEAMNLLGKNDQGKLIPTLPEDRKKIADS